MKGTEAILEILAREDIPFAVVYPGSGIENVIVALAGYEYRYAEEVLGKWQAKCVSQEAMGEINAFIQNQLPKWQKLQRLLNKTPATRR